MGRLTLNMLLSFAQFEREVTAERIRDKLAASRARGMWMGGVPPLGYAPDGRGLVIVEEHATLIRHLFARYLALGSVRRLADELAGARITVPARTTITGKPIGTGAFTRGQLYHLLKNVIYIGRIGHKDKTYPGLHPAIIDEDTFASVQASLADHLQGHRTRVQAAMISPLAGKLMDSAGEPLIATHTNKGKVRHRYYVSRALHQAKSDTGLRLPAREIGALVTEQLASALVDPLSLAGALHLDIAADEIVDLHTRSADLTSRLSQRGSTVLPRLVQQVRIGTAEIGITVDCQGLATDLGVERLPEAPATLALTCPARLTRSGQALRLVQDNGAVPQGSPDGSLVRLLVQARRWWTVLRTGEVSPTELAAREGVTRSYVSRVVRLAFLAPAVTEAILAGRQRAGVTVASLTVEGAILPDWQAQKAAFLPTRRAR